MDYQNKVAHFLAELNMAPDCIDFEASSEAFLLDMELGLKKEPSSVKMIPTYLSASGSTEVKKPIAVIDAGGTNFRTCLVTYDDNSRATEHLTINRMPGSDGHAITWNDFISHAAASVSPLLEHTDRIGFCFSYPTFMLPDGDGILLELTKQVKISGFEGRQICRDLKLKLRELGYDNIHIVLLNDTPAVLLSAVGADANVGEIGLVGLISGTGTNVSCILPTSSLREFGEYSKETMLINTESGGFSGLNRGEIDFELDSNTSDPGAYLYEKMTSGAYLGELCRLLLIKAVNCVLISPLTCDKYNEKYSLDSKAADLICRGEIKLGTEADTNIAKLLCTAVFDRAARCVCSNIAAVVKLLNKKSVCDNLLVSADGSVFRNSYVFNTKLIEYSDFYLGNALGCKVKYVSYENSTIFGTAVAALLN